MNTSFASTLPPLATSSKSLAQHWRDFDIRFRFKFVLPRLRRATIEGIKLDISSLSPIMKNNIIEGRYEVQERRLAKRYLSPEDRVLELGGALGFISLYCQKNIGVHQYATVEANPKTTEILKHNHVMNGIAPNVINVAASSEDGEIDLDIGNDFWCNSIVTHSDASTTVKVPALSLRSILARLDFEPTAFIVDIEGAEALLDFSALPQSVTRIIIELHPSIIGKAEVSRIITTLAALGFRLREEEVGTHLFVREAERLTLTTNQ